MDAKQVFGAFLSMIFKVSLWIIIIVVVYKCAIYGYSFGYDIFSDVPVATETTAVTVSVAVVDGKSDMEIGELLEEKGLIKDARVFWARVLLSDYKNKLRPGIYDLSTSMTTEEMLKIMSSDPEETEEEESDS
ncbi:MAG: endolytic transglycosylase MltG [Lachnospiraceae bacterium]|nr:endolytic transglycosylase MltG [Lachnospiraceae bacterium]